MCLLCTCPDDASDQSAVTRHARLVYFIQHLSQTMAQLVEMEGLLSDAERLGPGVGATTEQAHWSAQLERLRDLRAHIVDSLLPIKCRLEAQLYGPSTSAAPPATAQAPAAALAVKPSSGAAVLYAGAAPLPQPAHSPSPALTASSPQPSPQFSPQEGAQFAYSWPKSEVPESPPSLDAPGLSVQGLEGDSGLGNGLGNGLGLHRGFGSSHSFSGFDDEVCCAVATAGGFRVLTPP